MGTKFQQDTNKNIVLPYYDSEDDASEDEIAFNVEDTAIICKSPAVSTMGAAALKLKPRNTNQNTHSQSVKKQYKKSALKSNKKLSIKNHQNVSLDSEAGFLPNTSLMDGDDEVHEEDQCVPISFADDALKKKLFDGEDDKENYTPVQSTSTSKSGFKGWKSMIMSLSSKKQNKLDISRNNETGKKSEADGFTRDLQQDEVSLIDTSQDETKHLSEREIPNHESPEGQRIITKIIASIDDSNDESISFEKIKMKRL